MQLGKTLVVGEGTGREISHKDAGHDNFIGREAQEKGQQDHSVHAQQAAGPLQETCQVEENALSAQGNIGGNPDQ